MNDLITVIVPVYNAERYIDLCVESILSQTHKQIELLLVDDGSADRSLDKCKQLATRDSRIRVLHKENEGPLSARQHGLESASAQYVMFVDSDDWIKPDLCETLYTTMISEKVGMVTSGIIRWVSEDKMKYDYDTILAGNYIGENYRNEVLSHMLCDGVFPRRGIDASLNTKIFQKDILYPIMKKANQEYGHHFLDDTAVLYLYMLKISSISILHECFYFHRQYENHESVYYDEPGFEDKLKALHHFLSEEFRTYENAEMLIRQLDYCVCGYMHTKYFRQIASMIHYMPVMSPYLFPFDLVPRGATVLLYGAGKVGQSFYAQLKKLNYCMDILWEDKNWEKYLCLGLPVRTVSATNDVDYCVIAVQDEALSRVITDELVSLGMDAKKIIWKDPLLNMW